MATALDPLFIGSDMDVGYTGARAARTGAYLNSGTCTYELVQDSDGSVVGTGALTYVAASNGDYYGTIESTVTALLDVDGAYTLTITFVEVGYNDERVERLRAAYRT